MTDFSEIAQFCQEGCDRFEFLKGWFESNEIRASIIQTGSLNHFLVRPGGDRCYNSGEYIKTLTAHYDRYTDSPGANDNGAAVFQLLELTLFLKDASYPHNCQILLTDGEEITQGTPRTEQGSYKLGELFKTRGLEGIIFIILDMCGQGDTMVYSTGREKLTGVMSELEKRILTPLLELIPTYSRGKALNRIENFSDDLGFISHDYSTLQVSLIPWKERVNLCEGQLPPSWQTMHTVLDSVDRLESRSFRIMEGFLKGLSKVILPR